WLDNELISWFVICQDDTIRYNFLTLMTSAGAAFLMIRWLINQSESRHGEDIVQRITPPAVTLASTTS
ncbi:MAG: hypothetical protein O3B86_12080, partial [Planctomycetota bacterium]|nr:hypothetical protein [Planctomycetota bacterium]